MTISRKITAGVAVLSLVSLSACVTNPNTGHKVASRTAIGAGGGAAAGYLLGGLLGGGTTARIIGAGLGAAAGGYLGHRMDQQIKQLHEATAGSGVTVEKTPKGDGILVNLPDVTFGVNSSTISPDMRGALDGVAQNLVSNPDSLIDIMGFTDSTGSPQYNLDLSNRRADAVANFLAARGVARARIATVGYGEKYPVASNATPEGRARNRRVEIRITPITKQDAQAAQQQEQQQQH